MYGAIVNPRMVVVCQRARVCVDGLNCDDAAFAKGRGTHAASRRLDLPRFIGAVLPDLDVTTSGASPRKHGRLDGGPELSHTRGA